ncbi:hypothetical protein K450DRAFT_259744 [Umbelopsis ramanniana AG]|uniref:Coth protein-domain-containing protein n=1 Tax=Umbelopsis ramanniana AG TaxID=1314678 RepID=A0AAD5E566_UMBRA|nr:uncharacterized protein K450DRAFT_259744 [Umbelopsis ramanniana AG]KAI8575830.1 hypothetical protein K450DRAFT_259744 [Umbelopsis ramanniana AG]
MKTLLSLASLALAVNAATVTFRVVAPEATNVQVSIGGQSTTLNASDPDVPYYTGSANLDANVSYKYVVNGQAESFDRTLDSGRTQTMNDFYGREVTYANLPTLPNPIKGDSWTRMGTKTPAFDDNYFPTIFITGDDAQVQNLVANVPAQKIPVKYTFIGPDEVKVFENCSFGVHHPGGKKNEAKQTWEWSLPEGQSLYGRNWMKARNMEQDPTQMREKLYADILYAIGAYSNQANYVRIYINKDGYGTFNLVDDVIQYSFIDAVFYGTVTPPTQLGPLYDGSTGASFDYDEESANGFTSFIPNPDSPKDSSALAGPSLALKNLDVTNDAAVQNFTKTFDVDDFLRFMVIEYLTGSWDAYWMMQSNDGAYQDPADQRWYYLPQDFDGTFGLSIPADMDFVNKSYTTYPTTYPTATMINKLLQNPTIKTTFETYLKDITTTLFNNATLANRVLAVQERLKPEVAWDRNITQRSPGVNFHWTYQQFLDNVWEPVNSAVGGDGAGQWGLLGWVVARSDVVAKEFGLTLATTPVDGSKPNVNANSSIAVQASATSVPTGSQGAQVVNAAMSAGRSSTSNTAFVISSTIAATLVAALLMEF